MSAPLNRLILDPLATPWSRAARLLVVAALGGTAAFALCVAITLTQGIGTWGNNVPVCWAFGIVNFVWWVGIGHAGTFISAFLALLEQRWRTAVNRLAEAMTIFAIIQAGLYPLLHLGRPWFAYWVFPYPSRLGVWPQFKSALPWDAAAIGTYFTVSLLFWWVGMLPDLAAARDHGGSRRQRWIYGLLALGWRGSARAWRRYRIAYGLLAGLATPLVISVHSVVSLDFAETLLPGWHSTFFPPYFVAGALYSGFAAVALITLAVRRAFRLEAVIARGHLDKLACMILLTGWIVIYFYSMEAYAAWRHGESLHHYTVYPSVLTLTLLCNVLTPQVLWSRRARRSPLVLAVASLLISVGMWTERFVIVVGALSRDFLPSSWGDYRPSLVDLGLFSGSISFFLLLLLAFLRWLPVAARAELEEVQVEEAHELEVARA